LRQRLTIHRPPPSPDTDPETLALGVLGWLLQDSTRAERLLALTGLTPDALRETLGARTTQVAVLEFVCSHEPDLVAAAEALGVDPAALPEARERLNR